MAVNPASARLFTFDTGIERVLRDTPQSSATLPDRSEFGLPGRPVQNRLEQLLNVTDLDSWLRQAIEPPLAEKESLHPGRYQLLLESSREVIEPLQSGDAEGGPIAALAQLLDEERQTRVMLNVFRGALVQA